MILNIKNIIIRNILFVHLDIKLPILKEKLLSRRSSSASSSADPCSFEESEIGQLIDDFVKFDGRFRNENDICDFIDWLFGGVTAFSVADDSRYAEAEDRKLYDAYTGALETIFRQFLKNAPNTDEQKENYVFCIKR